MSNRVLVYYYRFNPIQTTLFGTNTPGPSRDFLDEEYRHRPSESKYYGTTDSSDEERLIKKVIERKVKKKEGGWATQKLLKRHFKKLKQWIWNAKVTRKFAIAKFNLL